MKRKSCKRILRSALSLFISLAALIGALPISGMMTALAEENTTSIVYEASEIQNVVDVYGSNSASSTGLTKASFADRLVLDEGIVVKHGITDKGEYDMYWDAQNEIVTSALYNVKKMRDFELKVRFNNTTKDWGVLPRIIFGVQEPTRWINNDGGGYTVGLYNEGNSYFNGVFNGAYGSNQDKTNYSDAKKFVNLWDIWYDLTVRVEGNRLTVTVLADYCEAYSYEYNLEALGAEYRGGYIGFVFGAGVSRIFRMTVTDLGGEVLEDVNNNLNNKYSILEDFDIYHSDTALSDNFTAANFDSYFALNEYSRLTSNYDPYTDEVTRYNNVSNTVTKAIVKAKPYRNFEMSVRVKSANWSMIPKLVFGASDPESWINRVDGGYEIGIYDTGKIFFNGMVNGKYVNAHDGIEGGQDSVDRGYIQNLQYDYITLILKVEGTKATMTVKTYSWANPNTYSWSFDLGNNYGGGYVGFAAGPGTCEFLNFSLKDLGGEADTAVKIIAVDTPNTVTVPVLTYVEDLVLPSTVSAIGDDSATYELPVEWDTSSYSRFVPADYTFTGTLSAIENAEGKTVLPDGQTVSITVTVTGEAVTPIRVACVGDSITWGDKAEANESYPAVLQQLLGPQYEVMNFGVCGATAQSDKAPYNTSTAYTQSLNSSPDVVIMMLGTNDSWADYWDADQFYSDYSALIEEYMYLESAPEVYLATSAACYIDSNISEAVNVQKLIAEELGIQTVDMYSFTENHSNWFTDGVHPTAKGYALMARAFAKAVFGKAIKGDTDDNWLINSVDLVTMKKVLLGAETVGEGIDLDMNSDNSVNILDLVRMKKAIVNEG